MPHDELSKRENLRKAGCWLFDYEGMPPLVSSFLGGIREKCFISTLDRLLKHEDVDLSEGIEKCMFEENFDPIEFQINPSDPMWQPFKGVRFSFRISRFDPLEYVIVDNETFLKYVRQACNGFLKEFPQKQKEVEQVFEANGLRY